MSVCVFLCLCVSACICGVQKNRSFNADIVHPVEKRREHKSTVQVRRTVSVHADLHTHLQQLPATHTHSVINYLHSGISARPNRLSEGERS